MSDLGQARTQAGRHTFLFDMSCCCSEENFSMDLVKLCKFLYKIQILEKEIITLAHIHSLALIHDVTMIIVQS